MLGREASRVPWMGLVKRANAGERLVHDRHNGAVLVYRTGVIICPGKYKVMRRNLQPAARNGYCSVKHTRDGGT